MKLNTPDNKIPEHIAIIMDGNGRWAGLQGKERLWGHSNGVDAVMKVIEASIKNAVKYLTLYAFSTENFGRPKNEVEGLMKLMCENAFKQTPELKKQGIRVVFIGDTEGLSDEVIKSMEYCMNETAQNNVLTVVIALNYSSRWEISRMTAHIAQQCRSGNIEPENIDENTVRRYLSTADIPDPDLIIRTGGEKRLSNFLLWQAAYSELYFTDVFWPEFEEKDLVMAIDEFKARDRRFGKLK